MVAGKWWLSLVEALRATVWKKFQHDAVHMSKTLNPQLHNCLLTVSYLTLVRSLRCPLKPISYRKKCMTWLEFFGDK